MSSNAVQAYPSTHGSAANRRGAQRQVRAPRASRSGAGWAGSANAAPAASTPPNARRRRDCLGRDAKIGRLVFGPRAGALARYGDGKTMMSYVDEANGADRSEALLWAAATGPLPAPSIDTKAQVLPIGDLHWPDAERLFLRVLHTIRPVQYAKLFGVPGQAQAGIDAYARLPLDLAHGGTGGRDYVTLQSRRVKSLTAAKIKKAVSDRLKGHPRLVDDFFGRPWVERFCGIEAAQALANNLPHHDSRELRAGLRDLYRAVFHAQGGIRPTGHGEPDQQFVILDVDPNRQRTSV